MNEVFLQKYEINIDEQSAVFSCCSGTPYERFQEGIIYDEILIINENSVDLSRLNNANCPVLFNHQTDNLLGIVEKAWIADEKVFVKVRFSKNDDLAIRIFKDLCDEICRNVSIGYQILEFKDVQENGKNIRYVEKFLIYEVSMVSIPADGKIGLRQLKNKKENLNMDEQKKQIIEQKIDKVIEDEKPSEIQLLKQQIDELKNELEQLKPSVVEQEKEDVVQKKITDEQEIRACGQSMNIDKETIQRAIENNLSIRDFKQQIKTKTFNIKETKKMSAFKDYLDTRDFSKPLVIRDFSGFAPSQLVQTTTEPLVELLRKKIAIKGYRTIGGLNGGNINIPLQSTRPSVYTVDVNQGATSDSTASFSTLALTPHKVVGTVVVGNQMLKVSNQDVETFIVNALTNQIAYQVQKYMANKILAGANTKLTYNSAIGYADILAAQAGVIGYQTIGEKRFIVNPSVNATLKNTLIGSNTAARMLAEDGRMNGYPIDISANVGNQVIFGAMEGLVAAFWGDMDVIFDVYSESRKGAVVITASTLFDAGIVAPQAFAVISQASSSSSESSDSSL